MNPQFVNKQLIIKYAVRICHMFSMCALSGKIIYEYLYGDFTSLSKGEGIFSAILGVVLIVSGLINTFLQKPTENLKENKVIWMRILYLKFIVTCLICTPIPKLIGFQRETHIALQFYTVVLFIIISPFLRFYREYYTEYNRQRKFSYENMDVLK